MNILFLSISEMSKFYCAIANEIKNNQPSLKVNKFYYLILTDLYKKYILNNSPKGDTEIVNIYKDFNLEKVKHYKLDEIEKYEKLYGIPNLWFYIVTDRTYVNLPLEKMYDILCWHFEYYENLFKREKIDLIFSVAEGGIIALTMRKTAEYYKIPGLYIYGSRISGRFYFTDNLYGISNELKQKYNKFISNGLNEKELKKAKEIISEYREKRVKPSFHQVYSSIPKFSGVSKVLKKVKNYYFGGLKNVMTISDTIKFSTYSKRFRSYYHKIFYSGLFQKPCNKDKFFFFALHYQPEIAVDLMAPYYKDQRIIIDFVSKALPVGYYLYVKDHPQSKGIRSIKYYKEIVKNPIVKLIKTEIDSYDLIEKCSGLIAITGTAGWEAYLLKKPVIVFGQVFYKLAKENVYFIDNIFKLPYILKKAAEKHISNDDDILKFCYAYYSCTYPGMIAPPSYSPDVLSDENIKNITWAIINEYNKINKVSG